MKRLIALIFGGFLYASGYAQHPLNVMTFNLRFNNPGDSANAWPNRKEMAASQILFHEADIVGVQEALEGQLKDLEQLMPGYRYVGVGRDDGKSKGEFSAILYRTSRLELLDSKTFWLSETPDVPGSKSWDAAITRVVTWAKFRDKKTRKTFYHFNTHFDHIGKEARRQSAQRLLQSVTEKVGKTPVIVTGDFNAVPTDEPIRIIIDSTNSNHLKDSKFLSQTPHYGPTGTFNAFKNKETSDDPIDYIFIKNGVKVLKHATLSQTWQGRFSSDHFPVIAEVIIP